MTKILSWNANHWQRQPQNAAFWKYLAHDLAPDIAILQEVRPIVAQTPIGQTDPGVPPGFFLDQSGCYSWEECYHDWGTGVFTNALPIRPIHIPMSHKDRKSVV